MKAKNRKKIVRITGACLLIGLALLVWRNTPSPRHSGGMQEYYSDDDGRTWFADDGTKITPFNHNGKQAVLAMVYRCGGGQEFVGYLEKFSDQTKERIETRRITSGLSATTRGASSSLLVKKPHEGDWISATDPKAEAVKTVICPGGGTDYERVVP